MTSKSAALLVSLFKLLLWEENLLAPPIATPNIDRCNRRQTRKAKELGYMLHA
jgi:hypothetical protein